MYLQQFFLVRFLKYLEGKSASVKINESIVARFGAIIPEPFATAASLIIVLPTTISS